MSSHNPFAYDELGNLIRDTLQDKVPAQKPPNGVWKRIKESLTPPKKTSNHLFTLRSSLIVQVALMFVLLTLGGTEMMFQFGIDSVPGGPTKIPSQYLPLSTKMLVEDNQPILVADEELLKSLNAEMEFNFTETKNEVDDEQPLALTSTDVLPHINSPEGRLLIKQNGYKFASQNNVILLEQSPGVPK